jgi:hypothetical protein
MNAGFKESLIEAAEWIRKNTAPDALIACPIEMGDILRAYSTRSVTASDNIGGLVLVFKEALPLYKEQFNNTLKYNADPFSCAIDLNASYVIVADKNKDRMAESRRFKKVFSNAEFFIYKRM